MFWAKKKKAKTKRDDVLKQAEAIASRKRQEVGEETLDQIKQAILKRENSKLESAKSTILKADEEKVRDNLNLWLRE